MEIISVKSSVVAKIAFDGNNLFIKFVDNGWYVYRNFPANLFAEFRNAQSKGTFLNRRIKPNFHGDKCPSPEL
ncbi:MAG: KTSC domain-containing protein [Selenomonadaceae bacterium]|nr:KTSC domain-containing protein [Selenomonadaceae bacterium]MBR4383680.1 KTSC domain-containing protein [Selenomonadaceae bacterium]